MRRFAFAIALLTGLLPAALVAADRPVVVELFTSQGCSSCPPADRLLTKLAQNDDVIALAWHVDYWDYLGWKDMFADPKYTERQKHYARSMGEKMVYTPQVIVDGLEHTVGSDASRIQKLIETSRELEPQIDLSVEQEGDLIIINAEAFSKLGGKVDVNIVHYRPSAEVDIKRGENAGATVTYTNIVEEYLHVGTWGGRGKLDLEAPVISDLPMVVLLQQKGYGPILAAVEIN